MNDFKVGEDVEFEVTKSGYPRWDVDHDEGNCFEPPQYVRCKVAVAVKERFTIVYNFNGATTEWSWKQPSKSLEMLACYSYNGYLRRVVKDAFTAVMTAKNNDGRTTCYACGASTKTVVGFSSSYQVCTKCGK